MYMRFFGQVWGFTRYMVIYGVYNVRPQSLREAKSKIYTISVFSSEKDLRNNYEIRQEHFTGAFCTPKCQKMKYNLNLNCSSERAVRIKIFLFLPITI